MPEKIEMVLFAVFLFSLALCSDLDVISAKSCEGAEYGANDVIVGLANPSAAYCIEMGYEYRIIHEPSGQKGVCIFPDGSQCDAWDFLKGKCGVSHSYCAVSGYGMETRTDGQNPFSKEYAVCIAEGGEVVGSVTELTGMSDKCKEGSPVPPLENGKTAGEPWSGVQLPTSFDWRNHNGYDWMTSVKDQGGCGSCWAFSAVGVLEAVHNIRHDNPYLDSDLSEQYLVSDCYYAGNCCGGWPSGALEHVRAEGIPDEGCMPYVDGVGCSCWNNCQNCTYHAGSGCSDVTCSDKCADWQRRVVKIDSSRHVSASPQAIKEHLIAKGPLSVCMGIGFSYGGRWDGDIYRCDYENGTINHALVAVGYDDVGGYWIIKNSWGTDWNGDGYFKVGYGECEVHRTAYYANDVFLPGDTGRDNRISLTDVVYLINYVLKNGDPPAPIQAGEVNCDDVVDILDVLYLTNYIFRSGPPPCL